ncbi:MAG TPA: hypothetical protein VHQ01_09295, partial [Pyrinomonadaceae bacterium]|nr:hypothetical protein [Pyrinomonadaceae bacterium]
MLLVDGLYYFCMAALVKTLVLSILPICFVGGVFGLTKTQPADGSDPFTPIERQAVTVEKHRVTY